MLGVIMDSEAFKVWSTVLLLILLIIGIINHIFTIKGIYTGKVLGLENGWKNSPRNGQDDEHHDYPSTPASGHSNDVSDGNEGQATQR